MFTNAPGDPGSIPGRVIPNTQKMVLDATLLNTQHYKIRIKGKVEQSRERSSAIPYTLVYRRGSHPLHLGVSKREPSGHSRLRSLTLLTYLGILNEDYQTSGDEKRKGMTPWAAPLVRYLGPFVKWTMEELKQMKLRTRKLMMLHEALHWRDDNHYICQEKKEEKDSPALKSAWMHQ